MSDHSENPLASPFEWISEEALSDVRLDDPPRDKIVEVCREVFADACREWSSAVAGQSEEWDVAPAAANPSAVVITETAMSSRDGTTNPGLAGLAVCNTLSVANGPDWCLAFIITGDGRFEVVQVA